MSDRTGAHINKELRNWEVQSQKLRTSGNICYGKIRSLLSVLETQASKSEINKMQTSIGNFLFKNFII